MEDDDDLSGIDEEQDIITRELEANIEKEQKDQDLSAAPSLVRSTTPRLSPPLLYGPLLPNTTPTQGSSLPTQGSSATAKVHNEPSTTKVGSTNADAILKLSNASTVITLDLTCNACSFDSGTQGSRPNRN